ncbi:MAG: hypothetical protein ABS36_00680 [Acidobacteria bacterium SCN 69-37]|nr:MAG: hypothetical protein ABS36_00680 [Acidobacteria bacterium SCN 69-37]
MPAGYYIGRHLVLLAVDDEGVDLEGTCRLPPGRDIVLYGLPFAPAIGRRVHVIRWQMIRDGSRGPVYRGRGEWQDGGGRPPLACAHAPPG